MADLKDLTVEGFVQITSSDEPAPAAEVFLPWPEPLARRWRRW